MNRADITAKLTKVIAEQLGVEPEQVKPEARFTEDLGADSLDAVELVMEVEEEFGVQIPDAEAEQLQTVGQAIDWLEANADQDDEE